MLPRICDAIRASSNSLHFISNSSPRLKSQKCHLYCPPPSSILDRRAFVPPVAGTLHDTLLNESLLLPAARDICRASSIFQHIYSKSPLPLKIPKMPPVLPPTLVDIGSPRIRASSCGNASRYINSRIPASPGGPRHLPSEFHLSAYELKFFPPA